MNLKDINKAALLRNFRQDQKLIAGSMVFVAVCGLVFVFTPLYQPNYVSEAKVWIRELSNQSYVTEDNNDPESQIKSLTSEGSPALTQIEILSSNQIRKTLENYLKRLDPDKYPSAFILPDISKVIKIKNELNTDIISLKLKWEKPALAQKLLQLALDKYQEINLSISQDLRKRRREYIDQRLSEVSQKLKDIRQKIKSYSLKTLSVNLDEQSKQLVTLKATLQNERADLLSNINNSQSKVQSLEHNLALKIPQALKAVAIGSSNENLVKLREDLDLAMQDYNSDQVRLAPENPKMIAQKNRINTIKSQIRQQLMRTLGTSRQDLKDETLGIFDPVRQSLVSDLASEQAQLYGFLSQGKSIDSSLQKVNAELGLLPQNKYDLDTLEQEEKALSAAYDELRKREIEARIKEADAVSNAVIVDPPNLPEKQSFPKPWHVVALSVLLGFIAGFAASATKTIVQDRCEGIDAIEEATQSKVLGVIPWVGGSKPNPDFKSSEHLSGASDPHLQTILSNLMVNASRHNAKVITFASTFASKPEDASLLIRLAEELRKKGDSICVVDADLKNPSLYRHAGLTLHRAVNFSDLVLETDQRQRHGLSLSEVDIAQAIVKDAHGIDYLSNQASLAEPFACFGSNAFSAMMETLKKSYDWVFIDVPNVGESPEFPLISRLSDGIALFVEHQVSYTRLQKITKRLKESHVPSIGSIIRESGKPLKK